MTQGRSDRPNAGFTLVEVLVAVSISGLVLTILSSVFIAFLHLNRRGTTMIDLNEVSIVMDAVTTELRQTIRPYGVVIWTAQADGTEGDSVGIFTTRLEGGINFPPVDTSAPTSRGWRYFVHDPIRGEVRQIDQPGEGPDSLPPQDGGRVLATNVQTFRVVRQGNLFEVTIVAVKNGQQARLQTAIWPRNE